ncbi:hypothetical protein [Enterococcus sp. UD-01]|jgi:hypothetical protein|uniref:hypothetical protein n=1 Tax=Enterococcus sp. UD-01 TaxID=3373911 RepID=UPI003835EC20
MNDHFDVFFHQQAIPFTKGTVLYQKNQTEEIIAACDKIYERKTGISLSFLEKNELSRKLNSVSIKKHIEIQFFQIELNWDVLLEELNVLFPQFIWIKIVEVVEGAFSTYFCELIPLSIEEKEEPIQFSVLSSLKQMGYSAKESVSSILEKKLVSAFHEENIEESMEPEAIPETASTIGTLSFPVEVTVEEPKPAARVRTKKKKAKKTVIDAEPISAMPKEKRQESEVVDSSAVENDILYLKESLKREKASKERLRVAKEKLEYELLAIENSLLVSGLKRFKKHQKITLEEEEWYKTVRIDLIHYDDMYKKAKFIEQSWHLNRQLVTITERMTVTKDQWIYERARVEKVKNSVSEMDLQAMMEQCHLINERVKVNSGFLFFKPKVKLYQIDYEQLEKISAFFDIIQTENRLLESVIEQKEYKS